MTLHGLSEWNPKSDMVRARAVLVICQLCHVTGPRLLLAKHLMADHAVTPNAELLERSLVPIPMPDGRARREMERAAAEAASRPVAPDPEIPSNVGVVIGEGHCLLAGCGKAFAQKYLGRRRIYCSKRCYHRARKQGGRT